MNLLEKIKSIFSIFKDDNTVDEMNLANLRAGLVMTPIIAIFEIVMIAIAAISLFNGGEIIRIYYLVCYIFLLSATAVAFAMLMRFRKSVRKRRRDMMLLAHVYAVIIMLWAVAITYLDMSRGGQLIVYLTVLVVLAYALYLHPWVVCIVFCASSAALMIFAKTFSDKAGEITINLIVFTVFMIIASAMRYDGKKGSVYKEAIIINQNEELSNLNEQLRVLSQIDMLTKLFNRRYYDETSPLIAEGCAGCGTSMAALLMDIDDFKKINDSFGHKTGDVCISAVSDIIIDETMMCMGTAYRFGGEEFLMLVPDCDKVRAVEIAESLRARVEKTSVEGVDYCVTISVGCFSEIPEDGSKADIFVNKADQAMYRAKASGKNRVVLY